MHNRYIRHNRRKYNLKVHIVLVTKYRKQLLKGSVADDVKQKIFDIANIRGYEIITMETDKDHIHILLSYDTTDRVCDIVKIVKQETTHYLWQKYSSYLSKQDWKKKTFWSDGYFVCSIGEVSSATIQKYIENQGQLAKDLQGSSHCLKAMGFRLRKRKNLIYEIHPGGGWNFKGEEIVKRNAPLSIVNPEILKANNDLADAVSNL